MKRISARGTSTHSDKDNSVDWANSEFGKAWIQASKDDPEKFPDGGVVHSTIMLDGSPLPKPIQESGSKEKPKTKKAKKAKSESGGGKRSGCPD